MSSHCTAASLSNHALLNISALLQQRYEDSPKDDKERLKKCWGYTDCGDCHRAPGHCGWCGLSQTCLPLPLDPLSRVFPLLSPMRYKFICPHGPERFELRTAGLGCQVSTITFLTSIVTIFCTLFGVLGLKYLWVLFKWIGAGLRARKSGYVVYEDGRGDVWVRKREGWGTWWRRLRGKETVWEVEEVDGGAVERSRWWWRWKRDGKGKVKSGERRPLLQ